MFNGIILNQGVVKKISKTAKGGNIFLEHQIEKIQL